MLRSLYWKLTLAFILVAFVTAGSVAVFIRVTSSDRLMQLIIDQQISSLKTALVTYYTTNGSWNGIADNWQTIQNQTQPTLSAPQQNTNPGPQPPNSHDRRMGFGLTDAQGKVLVSENPGPPAGTIPADAIASGTPVTVNGVKVGTILIPNQPPGLNPEEALFLQRSNQALLLAIGVALLVALIMGVFLARTLTRPLQALTQAARSIAQGKLEQEVKVRTRDEIGQLAESFNRMSQEVARANQLRRQMTADIAHDLRTPLTVIAGYVESMQEGVLQPTPQRLALIYAEIERLQNMVADLQMLSQADSGELSLNPQRIAARSLLERAAQLFQNHAERQKVSLLVADGEALPDVMVDEARLMQVMDNLIGNALRYTPAGGQIRLAACARPGKVEITVQDTGSGIDPEELPLIFDRFHRSDKSRHSESGESGLGLAIVKALVESQGGRVWADTTAGEGTTLHIELPVAPQ